jgi:hypothetical protein
MSLRGPTQSRISPSILQYTKTQPGVFIPSKYELAPMPIQTYPTRQGYIQDRDEYRVTSLIRPPPPRRTLQWLYALALMVVQEGGAVSYERDAPVPKYPRQRAEDMHVCLASREIPAIRKSLASESQGEWRCLVREVQVCLQGYLALYDYRGTSLIRKRPPPPRTTIEL